MGTAEGTTERTRGEVAAGVIVAVVVIVRAEVSLTVGCDADVTEGMCAHVGRVDEQLVSKTMAQTVAKTDFPVAHSFLVGTTLSI